jgi:anaerobic selenocysteine-containing dehydrogenase
VKPDGYESVHFESGAEIRNDIARCIPAYAQIANLKNGGDNFQWGGAMLCADRKFPTDDGKAHFQPAIPPNLGAPSVGSNGTFVLATRRGKQFNSMVQQNRDPLTGAERDHIFISPADARQLGLATGDTVLVRSEIGEYRGRAFVADVAPGTLQGHWPEVLPLIPHGRVDAFGGVPDYNAEVTIAPSK